MEQTDIVKMSPKGQLVVPQEIREKESFQPGDRFIPLSIKGGILFKKIKIPNAKIEFKKLSKEIEAKFKKVKINSKDVAGAIKWAKKE